MKRPAAPASDFAVYRREPVDGRPECVKQVGVDVAQERDNVGGHSWGVRRSLRPGVLGVEFRHPLDCEFEIDALRLVIEHPMCPSHGAS